MPAAAEIDDEAALLLLRFGGAVDGPAYRAMMTSWFQRYPRAIGYDWLYDLRGYAGTISHDDVAAVAARYDPLARGRDEGRLSVFVTPDPGFRFWVRACALKFPRRRLVTVDDLPAAARLLGEARLAALSARDS
ncbi:MAG: hypothetical protein K2X11_19435 [Acetobacteraceae bacterium]|nr:hypothetical protein [Acetobacteraceae bacterium]